MEKDPEMPWKTVSRKYRLDPFEQIRSPGFTGLRTYAGFWLKIREFLDAAKITWEMRDHRTPLPKPDFSKMFGFRFKQRELLEKALSFEMSGLIGAPTRYGKSTLIVNTCRAYPGIDTVILIPGADLLKQTVDDMRKALPYREVVGMGGSYRTKYQSKDITVCSMDSMHKLNEDTRLILIDEPHSSVTESRLPELMRFRRARKIGFGATLDGRYDKRDPLIVGAIGPVLVNRTYLEAVAEGAICPLVIICVAVPVTVEESKRYRSRDNAYKSLFWLSPKVREIALWLGDQVIPPDKQVLFFIKREEQAHFLHEAAQLPMTVAVAQLMTSGQRRDTLEAMKAVEITRCASTDIYSTGVTFSQLRYVINLSGGGGSATAIQKPGRLAEVIPGKKYGVMVEPFFITDPNAGQDGVAKIFRSVAGGLCRDSQARLKEYRKRGYIIEFVKGWQALADAINKYQ